ncbi:MAG: MGDG synthase family glycosyltransferase [Clostridia bacterium]|jgi:processive 1,2-diacylglycerol beta-glucosyltransferase
MKKILIFYATYGGGHLSAAKSIKQYLEDHDTNLQIEMIDCVEYINKALNSVTTAAYRQMAKKAPWAWEKVYYKSSHGMLAKVSSTSNKIMAIKIAKLFKTFEPDVVISTHPFGSQMTSYLKKKQRTHCTLATVMTDFASHEQWLVGNAFVDYFFVSNEDMKKEMIQQGVANDKIFVTGIPVSKRFSESFDCTSLYKEFDLTPNKKTILFFGGGEFGLGKEKTVAILQALASSFSDIQVIAIAGKNEKMKDAFLQVVAQYHKEDCIKVLTYTTQVPELMAISDLVITKPGGLTSSESLVSGLPMLLINPLPGQEEENAVFLEKAGVAVWLKSSDDPTYVLTSILNNEQQLKQMHDATAFIAKKDATETICNLALGDTL